MADCDCVCSDCNCDCSGDCCVQCLCCACQLCLETDRFGACCCSDKCCCRFVAALCAIAVATLVAVLVAAYAVDVPARVTVEDARLGRFALTGAANGTALAYDVSLAVAVRNRNFATGAWRGAPLDAELRFRGQTFARASAPLESAEWGLFRSRGKGVYRVTATSAAADSGAPPVALGGDALAEFVRESVAGVFVLELAVVGGKQAKSVVSATCPLMLPLPTVPLAFTRVKCT